MTQSILLENNDYHEECTWEPGDYTLKVIFKSPAQFECFHVMVDDAWRFFRLFSEYELDGRARGFFHASTINGMEVMLNLDHIKICHVLWDIFGDRSIPEGYEGVKIGLIGTDAPFEACCGEPEEISRLLYWAETESGMGNDVLTFDDEDDETVMINRHAVTYILVPSEYYNEGLRIEDEIENSC